MSAADDLAIAKLLDQAVSLLRQSHQWHRLDEEIQRTRWPAALNKMTPDDATTLIKPPEAALLLLQMRAELGNMAALRIQLLQRVRLREEQLAIICQAAAHALYARQGASGEAFALQMLLAGVRQALATKEA